jgi:hypothetical protein
MTASRNGHGRARKEALYRQKQRLKEPDTDRLKLVKVVDVDVLDQVRPEGLGGDLPGFGPVLQRRDQVAQCPGDQRHCQDKGRAGVAAPPVALPQFGLRHAFRHRLAQPVQHHGQRGDRKTRLDPAADVQPPKRLQHIRAKTPGPDHRGDDDHVQAKHDDLVDPDHQVRQRHRQHHLAHSLPGRAARHVGEIHDLGRHCAQRHDRHPHHRRHGIDDRGQKGGHRAKAEQHQDRHQEGKGRDRLHQVKDRGQHPFDPGPAPGCDALRHAAQNPQRDCDGNRRQRDHRTVPLPEDRKIEHQRPGQ